MNKFISNLIIPFLFCYNCYSQGVTVEDFFKNLKVNANFNELSCNLNEKKYFDDFDFENFTPFNNSKKGNNKYEIQYKNNSIVRIRIPYFKNEISLIKIYEFRSLVFFAVFLKNSYNELYPISEILVHNMSLKKSIYINCPNLIKSDSEKSFEFNKDFQISWITSIFLLEKRFTAIYRLNFFDRICISHSKCIDKNGNNYEELSYYCDDRKVYLDDFSFEKLYFSLNNGINSKICIVGTISPQIVKNYPNFLFSSLKYN